ncbi:hypothetical protein L3Y34_005892 [Caenorhabditis briggsae]|uniref:CUB-like domain-containing protein n=1 Tax=Caenorhabditis briggsae TaxID=6238 RepID=A0AAE9CYH8_CAEBR|nr:hypothetical protein L3Y34_005892 [Caenorhabditis briggsae]
MHLSVIPLINTILSSFVNEPADLTCPKVPISVDTLTGSFPSGGLAQFPANYDCGIDFKIPTGKVLKFKVRTEADEPGDKVVIRDSIGALNEFTSPSSVFYAAAEKATVWVKTESSSSSFHFTWEYIDVSGFTEIEKSFETFIPLNLTANHYYRFKSQTYTVYPQPITALAASLSGGVDSSLKNIFVYDGENLDSKFVGNLEQFLKNKTPKITGRYLTLVNFYRLPSDSYLFVTDYSQYRNYDFVILSKDKPYRIKKTSTIKEHGVSPVTVFYCIDSNETYLTDLKFMNMTRENFRDYDQSVSFRLFSDENPYYNKLYYRNYITRSYYSQRFDPKSLPQQISSNAFTMELNQGEIEFELKSGPMEDYTKVMPGRKGKICSPSIWHQNGAASYFANFTATETVKFVFTVENMKTIKPGEALLVEVGQPHSYSDPKFFKLTSQSYRKEAIGTYMAVTFTGTSEKSSFTLNYNVESTHSSTSPHNREWGYSTSPHNREWGMNSSVSAGFSVLVLIVALIF